MEFNLENLCKMFVEQAEVGMGWADIEAKVKYLNPALTRMLGLEKPEETYGLPVLQFYEPETISRLENTILTTVMDKGLWVGELPLVSKTGETRNTLNYLFGLKDDSGNLFSFGNIVIPK